MMNLVRRELQLLTHGARLFEGSACPLEPLRTAQVQMAAFSSGLEGLAKIDASNFRIQRRISALCSKNAIRDSALQTNL
jgi:hypothetical protein